MKRSTLPLSWLAVLSQFFWALPARALTINNPAEINTKILCPIFGWIFVFLIIASAIMGLAGGYMYLFSKGNAEKVAKANKTLMYAAIGVVVALAAKGIPQLITGLFGATLSPQGQC